MKKWIIIGIIILLLIGGAFVYRYYWKKGNVDQFNTNDQGFRYSGQSVDLDVNYVDSASVDFGVPIYPEAIAAYENSTGEVEINNKKFLMGSFVTGDSKEQVVEYYKTQIQGAIIGTLEGDTTQTIIKTSGDISINVSTKNSQTNIIIIKPS